MHTICTHTDTEYRIQNTDTEQKQNNMQHTEDNREQDNKDNREHNREQDTGATEKNIYTSTENSAHSYEHIFLIFMMNTYISKNSIIQLYTNIIHFVHLIDEVNK